MTRTNWIFIGLLTVLAVGSIFAFSNPDQAQKLAEAQRDAALSPELRDIFLGTLALAIGGYLAWFFLIRKE